MAMHGCVAGSQGTSANSGAFALSTQILTRVAEVLHVGDSIVFSIYCIKWHASNSFESLE